MSAFICSNSQVQIIATNYVNFFGGDIKKVFNTLLSENVKSVNCRYLVNQKKPRLKFENIDCNVKPIQLLKLVECLEYQSCEHSRYYNSKAYRMIRELTDKIIPIICNEYNIERLKINSLEDYQTANWSI